MEKKNHHYISQVYLRGFSDSNINPYRVAAIDLKRKKQLPPQTPRNLGSLRFFNRFDADGIDPQAIEDMLGKFEGKVAPAIAEIERSNFFEGNAGNTVLSLMTLFSVRVPKTRNAFAELMEQSLLLLAREDFGKYDNWEQMKEALTDPGCPIEDEESFEYLRDLFFRDECRIKFPREAVISLEFSLIGQQFERLSMRNWSIVRPSSFSDRFITSDSPVVLKWLRPDEIPPLFRRSPGYGMRETFVFFPLNSRLAILGKYDSAPEAIECSSEETAEFNSLMIENALDQVYFPKSGFQFKGRGNRLFSASNLLDEIQRLESNQ